MANNKGFQEKMKSFFRGFNKGTNVPRTRSEEYLTLTEELENELKPESSLANRLKAAKEICEVARVRKLESYTVEKLWTLLEDLLKPEVNRDTRHTIIKLFTHVCYFQEERQGYLRAKFFEFIRQHNVDDDAVEKFEFLKALTESGRDVAYFEEKIGQLLLLWMGSGILQKNIKTGDFMCFLNNFIKYNQSFIDQEILVGMIENVCFMACTTQDKNDVLECLQVLETVLAYCSLPPSSLRTFLATLCRTVNSEALCQASWKTVRNLLGTHLGHSALLTMCQFMETGEKTDDYAVIRGAVFYVGVSLWGGKVVRSLKYSPATILSSFAAALERKHIFVSYEVILRLQDLVKCNGDALPAITWDPILEIMETVVDNLQTPEWQSDASNLKKLVRVINETLDSVESLVETGGFSGALHKFYDVVESASEFRSESSMIKLLAYKHKTNLQRIHANWMNHAIMFAEKHTREETRPNLKVAAMKIIHEVALAQIDTHHEELVDKIVLHYFRNLDMESNILVREAGVQFLVEFLMEGPLVKKSSEMLGILEKIIHRPYEVNSKEALHENDVLDITAAVNGVIQLFQRKIYQYPPVLGIACYKILVRHLSNHYRRPGVLDFCWSIRHNIFKCFFAIRANSLYHLGFPDSVTGIKTLSNGIRFSPYLCVDHRDGEKPEVSHKSESVTPAHEGGQMQPLSSASSLSTSVASSNSTTVLGSSNLSLASNTSSTPSVNGTLGTNSSSGVGTASNSQSNAPTAPTTFSISLKLACELVVRSLKCEKDFHILELILKEIPFVLENKALILSRHGNDIDYMANALCSMITDKSINFESLRNSPPQLSRSDLQAYVFPILTSLVSYHVHLEPPVQLKIVKCLEQGLVTKCSRICILALSICTLEMKDTMHKLLPEVLLALSKITARRNIAIPVLEFLSTLIHLPRVFASFVQDQYMSIFAIALPYTNPSKFNHYTVSLAHHVIAMWFLKCRLSFRRGFVSYIMKGLENNVWAPFEEETRRTDRELQNEDSANRKRSSSLTDQTYKRRERPISGHSNANQLGPAHRPGLDPKPAIDKATMTFHQELTETCVDLMARYAFADCSALPTRFTSSNALLAGGDSKTWIVENKIITITTSGCTQKALKDGFCDKCWLQCKKSFDFSPSSDGPDWDGSGERSPVGYGESSFSQQRRRHRSAFAGISQSKLASLGQTEDSKTKDDLHLESKASISEIDEKGRYSMYADHKGKQETSYCLCSCQGWAELYIRRPTGNTSWMMRIQNQLVNFSNFEWPMKELACMYVTVTNSTGLRQIQLQQQQESSAAASIKNSPIHLSNSNIRSSLSNLSGSQTGINSTSGRQSEQSSYQSPSSPSSPHAPGSPIDESHPDYGRKNPVKRSNSSPEMGSSFKAFYLAHQRNIEEQEEDEVCGILSEEVQKLASGSLQLENEKNDSSGGTTDGADHHVEKEPKIKPTSPFQCYESIPEEISGSGQENERSEPEQQPFLRERLSTISVMTPARRNTGLPLRRMVSVESTMNRVNPFQSQPIMSSAPANEVGARAGISPSFVFLQLCSQGMFGSSSKPIHIPPGDQTQRSLRVLDSIPPYETHKIGVVYVGTNQESQEALILRNQYGSSRYREFLQGLGKLIRLEQVDPQKTFLGGLSRDGTDGEFTYIWQDDVMQVIFHVATLMPNTASDPNGTNKKRHIGNDFVAIIYNDSGKEYDISTLKCQFLYACVVIEPLDHKTNRVTVKAKSDLVDQIGHAEPKIVSDQNLPIMARQWALHSNLASRIFQSAKTPDPYASNWLERLRQIKRLRAKVAQESKKPTGNADDQLDRSGSSSARKTFIVEDFTEFMCP